MVQWNDLNDESMKRWETNAEFWDDYMGDQSNRFHRELIRPFTEKLLQIEPGHHVLDIACGNGNFTRRLSKLGANVVAFDYSSKMIERAEERTVDKSRISYRVVDATNSAALLDLGKETFDRAVANMALMDIADIRPLVSSLHKLLKRDGSVVFSIPHPCFQTPKMRTVQETEDVDGVLITRNSIQTFDYLTPVPYEALGIRGQPTPHFMFHRSLTYYFDEFLSAGFILDGFEEPSFTKESDAGKFDWYDIPAVCIFRFIKR